MRAARYEGVCLSSGSATRSSNNHDVKQRRPSFSSDLEVTGSAGYCTVESSDWASGHKPTYLHEFVLTMLAEVWHKPLGSAVTARMGHGNDNSWSILDLDRRERRPGSNNRITLLQRGAGDIADAN